MRLCKGCKLTKAPTEFHKGSKTYCKPCAVAKAVAWQKANKEKKRKNALRYYYGHKEEQSAYKKEYRKRPEVKVRERKYKKEYCKKNPDTTRRLWRKRWREKHPDLVAKSRRRRAKRRWAKMRGVPVQATKEQLDARWEIWAGRCWMCGNEADEWDHVKPLAKGGAHFPCNLRPACGKCNRKKQDKWPFQKEAA